MNRSKRSLQEVVASAAIASCYKRFKAADVATEVAARDHDEELIHELEDGRSGGHSRQIILSQYWQAILLAPIGAGEPSTQIRFTARYHALSVSHKLRLLEATQRDEIATDLLKNCFQTMSVAEQLELLRLSPYHKTEIGNHIMVTQFPVMSDELRMRFLEVAPKNILVTMLEKHLEWLSIREALTAAQNLDDRQYADIRRQTSELIWKKRDICDIDDLAKLGQITLPKFGREIVAEIRNRCRPILRRAVPNATIPSPRLMQSPSLRPNRSSSLAILFPTLMAKCYQIGDDDPNSRFIGHGPLMSIPPCNQGACNRASFGIDLVVDWASAEYGFVHVILTKELGEFIEAVVSISDGVDREFDVGIIDDDSPSLEILWPMPRLGTPSCVSIRAHLQQTEPDEDEMVSECQDASNSRGVQAGSCHSCLPDDEDPSLNGPVSIDSIVEELMSQEEITDIDQMKLRLVYNDPRIKPLVDMIIEKANIESRRLSNA